MSGRTRRTFGDPEKCPVAPGGHLGTRRNVRSHQADIGMLFRCRQGGCSYSCYHQPATTTMEMEGRDLAYPFNGEKLSKYDRALLSPNDLLEYKRIRKNRLQRLGVANRKDNFQNVTLGVSQTDHDAQKPTSTKHKKLYQKRGSIKHHENRKRAVYCPQANTTPAILKKRRLAWSKQRKSQRRRAAGLKRQEAADLEARNRIAELQASLSLAETNLEQAKKKEDNGSTDQLLGMLTKQVDNLKVAMLPIQHLIQCHQAGPDHEVYDVDDDAVPQDPDDDDDSCVMIESQSSNDASALLKPADGKTSSSAFEIMEEAIDPEAPKKEIQYREESKRGVLEQVLRCQMMLQMLPSYLDSCTWENTTRSELALSRSAKLASPPLAAIPLVFVRQLPTQRVKILATISTYKQMSGEDEQTYGTETTSVMRGRDFSELLQPRAFITDATIYFYSALLMQRDHAMALAYPNAWVRSWIFGPHFYTQLTTAPVSNTAPGNTYFYCRVKHHGSRSPGNLQDHQWN